MKFSLKQLHIFVTMAHSDNMSQAAELLHLSQSACSMALASLESQLNGPLFDRHGKKLVLNARGRLLLPRAANLIAEADELARLLQQNRQGQELLGQLCIGASSTIGNYLMPALIGDFLNQHPKTKVTLRVANTEQIIQKLLQFEIDIGLVEGRCYHDEIETVLWRTDELVVICPNDSPLLKKAKITLTDIRDARFILREPGSGTRERFELAMGGVITPFLELGHTEAIKQAVKAGLGISCLSTVTVKDALKNGEFSCLKTPFLNLTRDFYLLYHKEKFRTDILTAFAKLLEES